MSQVSCIIPYYNGGQTIAQAIDSILYDPLCAEVVVVNDASPEPIAPHLTPRHRHFIAQRKLRLVELATNHGQGAARNIGVGLSVAPLISFLDQDDVYLPGYYKPVVDPLGKHPRVGAIEVSAEFVQDGKAIVDAPDLRYHACVNSVPWNVVVRRGTFWACGGFPVGPEFRTEIAGEDIVFKTALKRWFTVLTSPSKFIRHHVRAGSATDRFLKRTSVVDGKIVFSHTHANELDGSAHAAANAHLARAWEALQTLKQLEYREWTPR